jgi:DNA-binding CsgD family transcriptional regulator
MIKLIKTIYNSEQSLLFGFAFLSGGLSIWDLYIDLRRGAAFLHVALEAIIVIVSGFILSKIIAKLKKQKQIVQALEQESFILREDVQRYKISSRKFAHGISDLIDQQLNDWGLSKSEKDVALLLLKGLSLNEIADIRQTSGKTVRHQAGVVYSKANLEGRAQLSAFFLEDILNIS